MKGDLLGLHDRVCAECNKHFDATTEWVYKFEDYHTNKTEKVSWYCSYTCFRKEQKRRQRGRKRT